MILLSFLYRVHVNITSLANDTGINLSTARKWIALLEQSYIIFLLQPHYKNFSKRLVKLPKLYFYDTGLACSLLKIESPEQLSTHYLLGGLVESLIISDFYKQYYNNLKVPHLYFWRDNHGHELDCIIEKAVELIPIEIKSGKTIAKDYFKGLEYWYNLTNTKPNGYVIYGGDQTQSRTQATVLSWKDVDNIPKII